MDNTKFQKIGNHIETISYAYFDEEYEEEDNMLAALHEMAWKLVNLTRPEDKPWI